MKEEYNKIFNNVWDIEIKGNKYKFSYEDYINRAPKKKEKTAKQKAQQMLNNLNEDKEVRQEFDKLVRLEKLKNLNNE